MTFWTNSRIANHSAVLTAKTFAEAAASYVENGGEGKYLDKILLAIGDMSLSEIYPFDVRQLAEKLMPDQSNATKNRCVITPIRAVCNHAHDRGWGPAVKIRGLKQARPKRRHPASQAWLHAFTRQCSLDDLAHLAALVLFMAQTGARVSEAIELRWADIDLGAGTALLRKTKTDRNSQRFFPNQLAERLRELPRGHNPDDRVFRDKNRHGVNERIAAVCKRAGITYKSSHVCGRHAFATNTLEFGMDVKSVMEAGGWRSTAIFLGVYVNPRNAGRIVADRHNLYQFDNDL